MGVNVSFKFSITNLHSNELPARARLFFPPLDEGSDFHLEVSRYMPQVDLYYLSA